MASQASQSENDLTATLTGRLLNRIQVIQWQTLPLDVREIARQCVLDWIGVTLAGASDPLTLVLLEEALLDGGKPLASIVGHTCRVAPLQAALINGSASHVLDYDDVNMAMLGHPSVAILPALMALGEVNRSSLVQLIEAFIAGYEIACRVGVLVLPGHYLRGYHATSTIGALGAAAACAHLLKLDVKQMAHALAIAATEAAGLKAVFGTQCKPFHAGLAAHNGLRAARLAAMGMTGRCDILECKQGFAATMSPDFNPEGALAGLDEFHIRGNLFKYHASCFGTHSAIECARKLRDLNGIKPSDVARVTVRVEQGSDAVCNIAVPKNALEAKFSLRLMTAAALAGEDTSDLAFFDDAMINDNALCALRDKVTVEFATDWPKMQAEVIVMLRDGRTLNAIHDVAAKTSDYEEQGYRLRKKFERLVQPRLGKDRYATILRLLEAVERTPTCDLMAACAAG